MISTSGLDAVSPHPKGTQARVLLTSVFGPYARDDEFGSRAINPMELYHNQVTREQGSFSLRMFHRSWGLMMIQRNISAPSTLLDFPTLERFERELTSNEYDIVGISGIIPNFGKVREMCRRVRRLSPKSTIVIGGHIAAIPGIDKLIDADCVVRGEGIAWMRRYLGEDPSAPIVHPEILSGFGMHVLGMRIPDNTRDTAATIIPSVGCPMGCNFCTTSSFFGGKGKSVNFYQSGDELFDVMEHMESKLNVSSFFMMDENFLLNRPRAMQLLTRMKQAGKSWSMYVFSSANAIRRYSMDELVQLGVSWIWLGLESPKSSYAKLRDTDTLALAAELRQHGIKLLGSTIVGLEHHTPQNIRQEIEHARIFTSLCCTRRFRERRCTSKCRMKAECWTRSTWPTFMGSTNSTSSTRPFRATNRSGCSTGRFASTSSVMGQACFASATRSFKAGSAITIILTCACGSASRMRRRSSAPLTTQLCGRWKNG
jgi:hypothetical protein